MAINPTLLQPPADDEQSATIQSTIGGMQPGAFNTGQLQQAAGKLAEQQSAKTTQTLAQQGEEDLQQQARSYEIRQQEAGMNLKERQLRLNEVKFKNDQELRKLEGVINSEAFSREMKINYDNLGRAALNEKQLLDVAILQARSEQDLVQFKIKAEAMHKRRLQILQQSYKVLVQQTKQNFESSEQEKDQAMKAELARIKAAYDKKVAEAKAKSSKLGSIISGVFTVGGAIIGGIYSFGAGAPAGAAAGGMIGSQVGGLVSSAAQDEGI